MKMMNNDNKEKKKSSKKRKAMSFIFICIFSLFLIICNIFSCSDKKVIEPHILPPLKMANINLANSELESDMGVFKYATIKYGLLDVDTDDFASSVSPSTNINATYSGFYVDIRDWDTFIAAEDILVSAGIDFMYGIKIDFGSDGIDFKPYNQLWILNGRSPSFNVNLLYGQAIKLYFKDSSVTINGADEYMLSYIDLNTLFEEHGTQLLGIDFTGINQDYIPIGLTTNNFYSTGYDTGYEDGHSTGFDAGYKVGETNGYNAGFESGKSQGYNEGYEQGIQNAYNGGEYTIFKSVLSLIGNFTNLEILPGVKIIYIIGLIFISGLIKWFLGFIK